MRLILNSPLNLDVVFHLMGCENFRSIYRMDTKIMMIKCILFLVIFVGSKQVKLLQIYVKFKFCPRDVKFRENDSLLIHNKHV
jgi:hypothetical protein